jgi:hypothetical protein
MSLRTLPLLLAALCVAAPAAAADDVVILSKRAQVAAFAGEPVEVVRDRPLRDNESWESLGEYSLLVWETRAKAWLVDLEKDERCRDLSTEYMMRLDSKLNWLSSRNGFIELREGHGWCRITGIRPVDVKAMKAARRAEKGKA